MSTTEMLDIKNTPSKSANTFLSVFLCILTCGILDALIFLYAYIAKIKNLKIKKYIQKVNFDNAHSGHQCDF